MFRWFISEKGFLGSLERVGDLASNADTKSNINAQDILEAEANMVEAVYDEYLALVGEERKDENV